MAAKISKLMPRFKLEHIQSSKKSSLTVTVNDDTTSNLKLHLNLNFELESQKQNKTTLTIYDYVDSPTPQLHPLGSDWEEGEALSSTSCLPLASVVIVVSSVFQSKSF